jgi:hypothetical protein
MTVIRRDSSLWKTLSKGAFGGQVLVGIPEGSGSKGGESLAQIAMWLHDGTSRIPARPFLSMALDGRLSHVKAMITRLAKGVLEGKLEPHRALELLGQWARDRVVEGIDLGIAPENADSTIARKGSQTPLIDTGQLKTSITWVVEKDGTTTL